jgi:ABC-type uncharacterized transport system fused permease/ATPase subunit
VRSFGEARVIAATDLDESTVPPRVSKRPSTDHFLILDEALSGVEEGLERDIVSRLISARSISILVYIGHRKSIQHLFENKYSFGEPE